MARFKVAALIGILVFSLFPATAAEFNVRVMDNVDYTQDTFSYGYDGTVLKLNTSIENSGSVGCKYRIRTEFKRDNTTEVRWSAPYSLWPGSSNLMEMKYIPFNYTGVVNSTVELHYCGQQEELQDFTANISNRVVTNETVTATTRESNASSATVDVELENGMMVPKTAPPGWKPSTVKIEGGQAKLDYEPYIFQRSQNLTYTVLDNEGRVVGTSKVYLEPRSTIVSVLKDNLVEILLGVSVLMNLILIVGRKITPSDYLNL